jgi:hypothetical protein
LSLISHLTTSAKVSLGLKALGLSKEETAAADKLVSSVGTHPLTTVLLGKEHATVKDVIVTGVDIAMDGSVPGMRKVFSPLLGRNEIREPLAELIMGYVRVSPDSVHLTSLIEKLRYLPIPGIGDHVYASQQEFVSDGLLMYLNHLLKSDYNDEESTEIIADGDDPSFTLVSCPHCEGMFYHEA